MKEMVANSLTKALFVIKHEQFMKMTWIVDKKNCWLISNKKTILETLFNYVELI